MGRPSLVVQILTLLWISGAAWASPRNSVTPDVGIRDVGTHVHAIVGARIVPAPGQLIEVGTVVIRDGRIASVGRASTVDVPDDARVWDGTGRTVYAGLLESSATIGLPDKDALRQRANSHWNEHMLSDLRSAEAYAPDAGAMEPLRDLGFTAALVLPSNGIFRGRSALVSTAEGDRASTLLRADVAHHIALRNPGSPWDKQENVRYPGSLMGTIALIRQTLFDADWYRTARHDGLTEQNLALEALVDAVGGIELVVLDVPNERLLRVARQLVIEHDLRIAVRGAGAEYRQLGALADLDVPVILPVSYPPPPDVADPEDAVAVSLASLWHWESAPANAARVRAAGVEVALTSDGLDNRSDFPQRVRLAMQHGLSTADALAAVTTTPSRLLGVDDLLGTIAKGRLAHLTITDGDLFAEKTEILEVWIDGERHVIHEPADLDLRGTWDLAGDPLAGLQLVIDGDRDPGSWKARVQRDSIEVPASLVRLEGRRLTVAFTADTLGQRGVIRLSAEADKQQMRGRGVAADERIFPWQAAPVSSDSTHAAPGDDWQPALTPPQPPFPPVSYGAGLPPQPKAVLFRGATVWTSGPRGILEDADILVRSGRVDAIGRNLRAPKGAVVIDASGKHISPGLVDAHVHIGVMGGVNEWTQAVSSEVRIRDVLNAYDGRIYRHLAQGTTTVHSMHGSSNPIGGQNATFKLRWGSDADALLLQDAAPTIKFALGENVKHSNRGPHFTTRYPQTRMGVQELIRDRLAAAREYEARRRRDRNTRRDLELDPLVEVLTGKRLVHCHSYRQDEILGLIRIAEEFGFTVGTFQHVLEGYKVAEQLRSHGARASTFSDWWAYKYEVVDAIPYNAALMHFVGVGVSLNSDLSNFGGRIHTDAAKAVKYGGVPPEQALHMVTIEPARQLGAAHLIGSLEAGKDADLVVWSRSPLSSQTRCEQTWIDGRRYFDLDTDAARRQQVTEERARLIQAVLSKEND